MATILRKIAKNRLSPYTVRISLKSSINPAVYETTDKKAATGRGEPVYTSGAQT